MLKPLQREQLHNIAYDSIQYGLTHGVALVVDFKHMDEQLQANCATFVTLNKDEQLRGCIGMLTPLRPLAEDVAQNAFMAAFSDPRFPPLQQDELEYLKIHISILGAPETMTFDSEEDLIAQLRPGIDGLIMEMGGYRGTFLPSVWETLQDPRQFLQNLKLKSGLPADYWSEGIQIKRYTVEEF